MDVSVPLCTLSSQMLVLHVIDLNAEWSDSVLYSTLRSWHVVHLIATAKSLGSIGVWATGTSACLAMSDLRSVSSLHGVCLLTLRPLQGPVEF